MTSELATANNSPTQAWSAALGEAADDLTGLNRDTEQEFLAIGGSLIGFIGTVNLLSSGLTTLADLISGEHGLQASQALTGALSLSSEMRARADEGHQLLLRMRQEAERLKRTLGQFRATVSAFHSLGVLARIESGPASGGYANLAEEVPLLAGDVQSKVESALAGARELSLRLESDIRGGAALPQERSKDLPSLIAQVAEFLSSFRDMRKKAQHASLRMEARYGEISGAFTRLIISMQFHDITRQQIEHVVDVLRRVRGEAGAAHANVATASRRAAGVLALQSFQLANAGEKFSSSVSAVVQSLDDISVNVLQMVNESRTLPGLSGRDTFFERMEQGFEAVIASLEKCSQPDAETRAASRGLADIVAHMRAAVEQIRGLEMQMQQTAMHASAGARLLGAPVEAGGAPAVSIRKKAGEAVKEAQLLLDALASMSSAAASSPLPSGLAPLDKCLKQIRSAVVDLRASNDTSSQQIAEISACGAQLCDELTQARESFTVGRRFADAVSRVQGKLNEIVKDAQAGWSGDTNELLELGLAEFAGHYTMRGEMEVYESVMKAMGKSMHAVPVEAPEDDLGGNVELF